MAIGGSSSQDRPSGKPCLPGLGLPSPLGMPGPRLGAWSSAAGTLDQLPSHTLPGTTGLGLSPQPTSRIPEAKVQGRATPADVSVAGSFLPPHAYVLRFGVKPYGGVLG